MTEAKVPDTKSDWKAIDIFLFSNGQKSSPPRKYHLVTDQLDWWNTTLGFLAKSQYGSLHSMIDLYTIEGNKVETPMQLSHNTAYVAVAPPEIFINASYEKYLIKATRSWEKGQMRRSSNTMVLKPEEVQIENDKSICDTRVFDPMRIVRDGSVTLKTIVASMVDNQPSIIVKPEETFNKYTNNTINLNPVKLSDKVQKPSIVKNTNIVRKNSLPSPPRSRKPSLKRKDSVKINMEVTKDRPSLELNNNRNLSQNKIFKPIHKPRGSLPETILTKVNEVLSENKSFSSLKFTKEGSLTKASDVVSIVGDKEADMTNYYINAYREKPSIAVNPVINLSDNVNRQGGTHELFGEQFIGNDGDEVDNAEESKLAIGLINKDMTNNPLLMEPEVSSPLVSKGVKTDNDEALNNKEGTVNLKLNIEIWNYPNVPKVIATAITESETLIQEKGPQDSIEEKVFEPDKLNEISAERNNKVIIVKCACLNQNGAKTPVNFGNSNFLVYVPVCQLDGNYKRCDCKEDKGTTTSDHNSSVDYPVKKTVSCLSLYKGKAEKISYSEITSKNNSLEMKLETNTIHDKNEMTTIKRKSVAIRENQESVPQFPHLQHPTIPVSESVKDDIKVLITRMEPEKSECIVTNKESIGILHKFASKFTQTEWCDVLLEVKLQNDGHYSFHLPPLEMLKNYKP